MNPIFKPVFPSSREADILAEFQIQNPFGGDEYRATAEVVMDPAFPVTAIPDKAVQAAAARREKGIRFAPLVETGGGYPGLPLGLFCRTAGVAKNITRAIAVVGTRDMSLAGGVITDEIVGTLPEDAILVASLSLGVGQRAIAAALRLGQPVMAFMATSIEGATYPPALASLAEKVATTPGCVLASPFAGDNKPIAMNFILKNRVVALADEVVVVEAEQKGGAMITARIAKACGRRVYAVPGRTDDVRSRGCLDLVAEGTAELFLPWRRR